ncbi:hypothetical protein [Streptomyces sp. NPDC056300]|uniref:hypothetical protein n=1 Tax=Streptomyces sp. NPDC056300 TaxID=3345777 RepID=UPI0035E2B243
MIVGREAVTSWMSVEACRQAHGPKELLRIDGAVHKDRYVVPAIAKLLGPRHHPPPRRSPLRLGGAAAGPARTPGATERAGP